MINLFEILKLTNTQSLPVIFLQANVNKRGEHKKKKKKMWTLQVLSKILPEENVKKSISFSVYHL